MPRIGFKWLALLLCGLFAVFSLGYFLGGRVNTGLYAISAGAVADDAPLPSPAAATPEHPTPAHSPAQTPASLRVNINTASAEELSDLPGIGPTLAERIMVFREEHGAFTRPEDLTLVPGIGEKTFAALALLITV